MGTALECNQSSFVAVHLVFPVGSDRIRIFGFESESDSDSDRIGFRASDSDSDFGLGGGSVVSSHLPEGTLDFPDSRG